MTNSRYRWVIVAAGGLLGCVAIGGMFSLPVLLQPIARDTGWSVTGVSCAMTIGFLAMALTSMIWGTLSDRFGPLPVVLTGSIVIAARISSVVRQLTAETSHAAKGAMVMGAIPMPAETSETARLRWVSNQPVTHAIIGAKIAEIKPPTISPNMI